MDKELVIAFDADNTIWDTDAIFRQAQLAMLNVLAECGHIENPESKLDILRNIDAALGKQIGRFEYDFKLLAMALLEYFLSTEHIETSINKTLSNSYRLSNKLDSLADRAHNVFREYLSKIPDLYPDTFLVLSSLKKQRDKGLPLVMILFSEGDADRLKRVLHAHKIIEKGFFNKIVIKPKTRETYEALKHIGATKVDAKASGTEKKFVMVGDNLERDIKYANQAGFITVYKPSSFKGNEKILEPIEQPDYKIEVLEQLLVILNRIYTYPLFDLSALRISQSNS